MTDTNWELYLKLCDANESGALGDHGLATMILAVLKRDAWRRRESGDALGAVFENDTFEDYLLRPTRHGCGIESLSALRGRLEGVPYKGPQAIQALCQVIPNFIERTNLDTDEHPGGGGGTRSRHRCRGGA